jgi:hypothetical protein
MSGSRKEFFMIRIPMPALTVAALLLGTAVLQAQDLSEYRDFRLGSTLASVEKLSGVTASDVKALHLRPAQIQELRWRPSQRYSSGMVPTEAVREVTFTFYNDQLFQIVVDYDRQRTEGLTDADLIDSISTRYGVPVLQSTSLRTNATARPASAPTDGDAVVARWSSADASLSLVRGTYPTSLRLIVAQKTLEGLAQNAVAESVRLDHAEAPLREIERVNRNTEDGRVAGEKARGVNKPLFKP